LTTAIEQTLETYGIENWGAGYFDVNRKGNLIVHPAENDSRAADLKEIIEDLARRGIGTPVLLRFPQLVASQVRKLQRAFSKSIREYEYQGAHMCVYPMKVNQQRAVVEEYLREGSRYDFGLEAGSKAELYAALALDQPAESLLVLNGFKAEVVARAFTQVFFDDRALLVDLHRVNAHVRALVFVLAYGFAESALELAHLSGDKLGKTKEHGRADAASL